MTVSIGYVAIGRNEGERLAACLASLRKAGPGVVVYVDSGSTDDSLAIAKSFEAEIVSLDMSTPFTAARARNAGISRLFEKSDPEFVQVIDGDCELRDGWIAAAAAFLGDNTDVAVVCGRRRERRPEASVFNRLCDIEWNTPVGEALACGGDALMRARALNNAGLYDPRLIAGEEPELCIRLREQGWKIWRLDAEMTAHDAAMSKISQWWRRSVRAGHAFAEIAHLHRASPFGIWRGETRRAVIWAAMAPIAFFLALAVTPWAAFGFAIYPLQVARLYLAARARLGGDAAPWALFTVLGKFPEAVGVLRYHWGRLMGRRAGLLEYK